MSRTARRLLIAVVVLIVLLILADRIGDYVAEREAAKTLQNSQHLSSRPSVDIGGFPFLTQLASRDFDQVTVTANDVPVGQGSRTLDLSRLHVVLHSLTISRSFSSFHADTADATATITYASLGKPLGLDVRYAGGGRIVASKDVTFAGQTFSVKVSARPELVNGALSFAGTQVNDAGELGNAVADDLSHLFDISIPLQGIPFHIQVRSLKVTPQGIAVALTGRDLSYTK